MTAPGEASRRGGIIDVWPPAEDMPLRIELFGDDVESIRTFDPGTQRSSELREAVRIGPARELIIDATKAHELAQRLHVSSLTVRTAPLCSFPASSRARRLLVGLRAHTRVGTR